MYAKQENSGKILKRDQVCAPGLDKGEYACICVKMRETYRWRRLDKLSVNKFQQHKEDMVKQIFGNHGYLGNMRFVPIEITDAYGTCAATLNGKWIPQDEERNEEKEEYQIYKNDENNLWLYQVDGEWWIGTEENKTTRKAWGFATRKSDGTLYSRGPPWEVQNWKNWGKPTDSEGAVSRWYNCDMVVEAEHSSPALREHMATDALHTARGVLLHVHETHIPNAEHAKKVEELQVQLTMAIDHTESYRKAFTLLFNSLTSEKKLEIRKSSEFKHLFKQENLCSVCLSDDKIVRCVHIDCIGACQKCHDCWSASDTDGGGGGGGGVNTCCACGKDQYMDCPICREKALPDYMNIFACRHAVCWKCTCRGYETKKPIKNCPLCRAKI